jgi:hypothetical protein
VRGYIFGYIPTGDAASATPIQCCDLDILGEVFTFGPDLALCPVIEGLTTG